MSTQRLHLVELDGAECLQCGMHLIEPSIDQRRDIDTPRPIATTVPDVWKAATWNCERVPAPAGKLSPSLSKGGNH